MAQELKDYDIMDIEAMDDERLEKSSTGKIFVTRVYIKDEVDAVLAEKDAAIAKLNAENERLKRCEIWMKQHFYCEEVIACESAKNRRLNRALWIARAERAIEKQTHFALCHNHSIDLYLCINGASMPTERNTTMRQPCEWSMIWKKVAIKCRAKAEEYK